MSAASPYREEAVRQAEASSHGRGIVIGACALFSAAICVQLGLFGGSFEVMMASVGLGVLGGTVVGTTWGNDDGGQRVFIGLLGALALSFLISVQGVLSAWASVINSFIITWDATTDGYVLPLRLAEGFSVPDVIAVALCFAAAASLLVGLLLRIRNSALAIGCTVLIVAMAIFCGTATIVSVGFVLASGLFVAALLAIGKKRIVVSAKIGGGGMSSVAVNLMGVLLLTLGLACGIAYSIGDWSQASSMRAHALQSWNEMRFGTDTLPEGNFAKAYRMNQVDENAPASRLEISVDAADDFEEFYFRGFVGADYEGYAFDRASFVAYDGQWNGLFDWIENAGLDPMLQSAQYAQVNSALARQQPDSSRLTIEVDQANRRYGYAPYQTIAESDATPLLDLSLQPNGFFGLDKATLSVVPGSQATELFSPAPWVSASPDEVQGDVGQFLQAERAYRSFVYDTYLEGREGTDEVIRDFFFSGEGWDPSTKELYSIATRIRSMLESHCAFTLEPSGFSASGETDYVSWFLNREKQGNSSAFAAAAVLAFREVGVPARYVEGYLLSQANVDALREANQPTALLTAQEAHAWVEVYIDGVGWTPLEMTPGFYDKNYAAEQTIEISKEVAGDGSDSDISGTLDRSWDDWIPEELRPFAWIGLVLLLVMIAFAVFGLLEAQRYVRIRLRRRRLAGALEQACREMDELEKRPLGLTEVGDTQVSALLFARMKAAMKNAPVPFDADDPAAYGDSIGLWAVATSAAEYRRAVELIERERFGGVALNPHEARLVEDIIRRMEADLWRSAPAWRRPSLRYRFLFELPL